MPGWYHTDPTVPEYGADSALQSVPLPCPWQDLACEEYMGHRHSVPVDVLGPEEESIVVISDYAVHKALRIQPGALRLGLGRRDDVG